MEQQVALDDDIRVVSRDMSGWLKLVGVVSIIMGVITALTLVGLLTAWLPIWQGILLLRAGNDLGSVSIREREAVLSGLRHLKTYFIIQGVVVIIGIAFSMIVLFLVGVSSFLELFQGVY